MLDRIMQNLITVSTNSNKGTQGYSRESTKEYLPELFIKNNFRSSVESKDRSAACMQVAIWETESTQEMFDFENNKHVKVKEYRVEGANDIYMMHAETRNPRCIIVKSGVYNDNLYCGKVENLKGGWIFIPGGQIDAYRVIGHEEGGYLEAGGMLRIGRMHYFIKQIFNGYTSKFQDFTKNRSKSKIHLPALKQGTCKFCLCDEVDGVDDALVSPCSCKGSCAQVHIQCLKQWLINKVTRKSTATVEYLNYDNFSCELCKDELPTIFVVNGKSYNMLNECEQKNDPYIVLEGLPNDKSSTKNNITIKIKFPSNKCSQIIGRGHESDVRLEDVSISRQHCMIEFSNNQFSIKDNKSKFGTLVQLQSAQRVQMKRGVKVQVGRMVLQMYNKKMQNVYSQNRKP